jgi:hypothetical protein
MGNIQFNQRILVAIFPLNGFPGFGTRLAQEHVFVGHILENNKTVIFGMGIGFHAEGFKIQVRTAKIRGFSE